MIEAVLMEIFADGAELLQMSKDYNVHISVTRDPLSLRVEGLMPSLQALAEHISAVKNVRSPDISCILMC